MRVGRVHERLDDGSWRDFFMVLTDHDVSFHTAPPVIARDLATPVASYPLLALRYATGKRPVAPGDPPLDRREKEEGCFFIRLPNGLRHYFSAGSVATERLWAHEFHQRSEQAVRLINVSRGPSWPTPRSPLSHSSS